MTAPAARILGFDPGSLRAGWAVITGNSGGPRLLACGEIVLPPRAPFADRMANLYEAVADVIRDHHPAEAAVEAPFHGVSARSALQLAHARGAVLASLGSSGILVAEYAPASIKKAVTGNGRADKAQVEAMVRALLHEMTMALRTDVSDAAAVALCHLFSRGPLAILQRGVKSRLRRPTSKWISES